MLICFLEFEKLEESINGDKWEGNDIMNYELPTKPQPKAMLARYNELSLKKMKDSTPPNFDKTFAQIGQGSQNYTNSKPKHLSLTVKTSKKESCGVNPLYSSVQAKGPIKAESPCIPPRHPLPISK